MNIIKSKLTNNHVVIINNHASYFFFCYVYFTKKKKKRRRKKHRGLIDCQPESIICRLVDINKKAVFACASATSDFSATIQLQSLFDPCQVK